MGLSGAGSLGRVCVEELQARAAGGAQEKRGRQKMDAPEETVCLARCLRVAARFGHMATIDMLIEHWRGAGATDAGAPSLMGTSDRKGWTALTWGARYGFVACSLAAATAAAGDAGTW